MIDLVCIGGPGIFGLSFDATSSLVRVCFQAGDFTSFAEFDEVVGRDAASDDEEEPVDKMSDLATIQFELDAIPMGSGHLRRIDGRRAHQITTPKPNVARLSLHLPSGPYAKVVQLPEFSSIFLSMAPCRIPLLFQSAIAIKAENQKTNDNTQHI